LRLLGWAHFAWQPAAAVHTPRCTPSYAGDWRRAACLAFNMLHCQYLQMWMSMSMSALLLLLLLASLAIVAPNSWQKRNEIARCLA